MDPQANNNIRHHIPASLPPLESPSLVEMLLETNRIVGRAEKANGRQLERKRVVMRTRVCPSTSGCY